MLILKHWDASLRWHQTQLPRLHVAAQTQPHCFWPWARLHETSSDLFCSRSTFMCNADNPPVITKCRGTIQYKKNSNNTWLNKTEQSSSMCNPDLKRSAWVGIGYQLSKRKLQIPHSYFSILALWNETCPLARQRMKDHTSSITCPPSLTMNRKSMLEPEVSWNSAEHRQGFSSSGVLI